MPLLTDTERVGTTLGGKYRLDRILGRGGVGTVFAGVHAWTGRDVAVKLLHPEHARDRGVVDRFLQEARTATALRHPNVVDVLDMADFLSTGLFDQGDYRFRLGGQGQSIDWAEGGGVTLGLMPAVSVPEPTTQLTLWIAVGAMLRVVRRGRT